MPNDGDLKAVCDFMAKLRADVDNLIQSKKELAQSGTVGFNQQYVRFDPPFQRQPRVFLSPHAFAVDDNPVVNPPNQPPRANDVRAYVTWIDTRGFYFAVVGKPADSGAGYHGNNNVDWLAIEPR